MNDKELKENAANLYFYIQLTKDTTILKNNRRLKQCINK